MGEVIQGPWGGSPEEPTPSYHTMLEVLEGNEDKYREALAFLAPQDSVRFVPVDLQATDVAGVLALVRGEIGRTLDEKRNYVLAYKALEQMTEIDYTD